MLKIWSMKQQQQQAENAQTGDQKKKKKVTAAQIRVQKGQLFRALQSQTTLHSVAPDRTYFSDFCPGATDISELSLGTTMKTEFPDPDDILNFNLTIKPDEGMYKNGTFVFSFVVNQNFPHDPPKVKCTQKIYHPNIDLEGNVCLNILREDWKPVLNLNAVIVGLQFLFLEPNASDPLNKEAAENLRTDRDSFKRNVRTAMGGGSVRGERYEKVIMA
ncbi:NEDD8-conjugating protein ubc12 [Agyrium rufum]|nr:NEDD8-conjugating protein ubc12 [Agyrium rufum]